MKFSTKHFFSKCDQIRKKLKKSLMENIFFCAVKLTSNQLNYSRKGYSSIKDQIRGIFRTLSKINGGAFLKKIIYS